MTQTNFEKDILNGLQSNPKRLFSKYFYDEKGSAIFQEIMHMPEYYLPGCETEILRLRAKDIIRELPSKGYDVVELGAGDGTKTALFLDALLREKKNITYIPLDISPDILSVNEQFMRQKLPELAVKPIAGDYFDTLKSIKERDKPKVILFLGSNIGNFEGEKALDFIQFVKTFMSKGDYFMLGVDLKKHPRTILSAYDDPAGITKKFNINLLERINRELNADFDTAGFDHYASYDPLSGATKSFLISNMAQKVQVAGQTIGFHAFEPIHMEVSQKYSLEDLDQIRFKAGFSTDHHFTDSKSYFSISLFEV
ncbi:L-histidine N(alpha)-methyltransferase [Cyclobacterium plantarum]|uniref:L-histidine N(Alpha)-methyltransferase n=1 Tax=Cyclobacterium plantarum TaxID=2716263 RepID=A0ABX0HCV8_9BACT|nr:L-histidine N(alpha)-methyltransferase [Cyclobacterium plantarum]NHE59155.1 L-histidine N(alpha)-methyltransferase [Cyclobacterium plantarum]